MATIERREKGWRVKIRRAGVPPMSETFRTKAEASAWAAMKEAEILAGQRGMVPDKSVGDLIDRYIREVVPGKRGARPEEMRLRRLAGLPTPKSPAPRSPDPLAMIRLPDLDAEHIAAWRDRRVREVSVQSLLREWATLSAAFNHAAREWRWLQKNPMSGVKKPAPPAPRTQQFTADVIDRLLLACGYDHQAAPETATARVGAAMLFALETAMRAGEICRLTWDRVDLSRRVAHLNEIDPETGRYKTKNASARDVPLSREAVRIIEQLALVRVDGEPVFRMEPDSLDALFRKAKARALVSDLHFHDTRRTALTRLAAKVDVLTLAKISGHKDLRILQAVYYAPDMGAVAERLD